MGEHKISRIMGELKLRFWEGHDPVRSFVVCCLGGGGGGLGLDYV